jgi:hypothetical protein
MIKKCTRMQGVFSVLLCLTATDTHCFHKRKQEPEQKQIFNAIALEQRFACNVLIGWQKYIRQICKKDIPWDLFINRVAPFLVRRKFDIFRKIPLASSTKISKIYFLPTCQIETVDSEKTATQYNLLKHEIPMLAPIEPELHVVENGKNKRLEIFNHRIECSQRICLGSEHCDTVLCHTRHYDRRGSLIAVAAHDKIVLFCLVSKLKPVLDIPWNDIKPTQSASETGQK